MALKPFSAESLVSLGADDGETILAPIDLAGYAAFEAAVELAANWQDFAVNEHTTKEAFDRAVRGDIADVVARLEAWRDEVLAFVAEEE